MADELREKMLTALSPDTRCDVCGHTRKFAKATREMCSNYGGRHVWPKLEAPVGEGED